MNTQETDLSENKALMRPYDLVGERSREAHYYIVQSELATHSSKGALKSTDVYREFLKVEPGDRSKGEADRFTCKKFTLKRGDDPQVAIPSLEGFSLICGRVLAINYLSVAFSGRSIFLRFTHDLRQSTCVIEVCRQPVLLVPPETLREQEPV